MTLQPQAYVEKPKQVEAVQFNGGSENGPEIVGWVNGAGVPAVWLDATEPTETELGRVEVIRISSASGIIVANIGDVIFTEGAGFSVLTADEFNKKYASA